MISKTVTTLFTILTLVVGHNISFAKEKTIYIASKSVPLELRYLINTLQISSLNKKDDAKLTAEIKKLDKNLAHVSAPDIYTITKAEIYKAVISISANKKEQSSINVTSLPEFKERLEKLDLSTYGQFSGWVVKSIKSDMVNILENENFQKLISSKRKSRKANKAMRNQARKAEIIIPIYKQVITRTPAELELLMQSKLLSTLTRISNYLDFMVRFTTERYRGKSRKFFTKKIIKVQKQFESNLDKLLAPILNGKVTIPANQDVWTPKQGGEIPKKKKTYTPPKTLPAPVDDWEEDNEYILDLLIPNYTPPATLPTPTNEWGEGEPEELPKTAPKPADPDEDWLIN